MHSHSRFGDPPLIEIMRRRRWTLGGLRWQHRIEDGCGAAVRLPCPGCESLIFLDDQSGNILGSPYRTEARRVATCCSSPPGGGERNRDGASRTLGHGVSRTPWSHPPLYAHARAKPPTEAGL